MTSIAKASAYLTVSADPLKAGQNAGLDRSDADAEILGASMPLGQAQVQLDEDVLPQGIHLSLTIIKLMPELSQLCILMVAFICVVGLHLR